MDKKEKIIEFSEYCNLCYKNVGNTKYVCSLCVNCNLCSNCEQEHIHPVVKCTGLHLSTIPEIYKYFKFHQMKTVKKPSIFFSNISNKFKKDQQFEFKLSTLTTEISMEKNDQWVITVTIENTMNVPFDQSLDLMLIARNTKDLKMEEMKINNSFHQREVFEYLIKIGSGNENREIDMLLELYSTKVQVNANVLNIKIKVSDKVDDKDLNDYFAKYPNIIVLQKDQKEIIKKIIDNKITTEHPYIILSICKNVKWNYDDAAKELKDMLWKNKTKTNDVNYSK